MSLPLLCTSHTTKSAVKSRGEYFRYRKAQASLDAKQQGYQNTTNVINYLASHDRDHLLAEASCRTLDREAAFKRANTNSRLQKATMMSVGLFTLARSY